MRYFYEHYVRGAAGPPAAAGDAYAALWLRPGAPPEVVRAAYRALAAVHHPDAGGDAAVMRRLSGAYAALCRHGGGANR